VYKIQSEFSKGGDVVFIGKFWEVPGIFWTGIIAYTQYTFRILGNIFRRIQK
jgi:hypothetical protein